MGANTFSMAIVGPWVGYAFYKLTKVCHGPDALAIFLAMATADFSTYCVTSVQLGIAFPDQQSGVGGAAAKFLGIFATTQVPLAIAEGFLGILLFRFLANVAAPQLRKLGVLADEPAESADAAEVSHA